MRMSPVTAALVVMLVMSILLPGCGPFASPESEDPKPVSWVYTKAQAQRAMQVSWNLWSTRDYKTYHAIDKLWGTAYNWCEGAKACTGVRIEGQLYPSRDGGVLKEITLHYLDSAGQTIETNATGLVRESIRFKVYQEVQRLAR